MWKQLAKLALELVGAVTFGLGTALYTVGGWLRTAGLELGRMADGLS